jgi:cytochrome P450
MDIAEGVEKEPEALSHRILAVNVAAIHTTSMSFTTALYYLAAHFDDYAELLREEVSEAIRKEGWTKVTMTKCRKLDSFVKEALRLHPLGSGAFISLLGLSNILL